MSKSESEPDGPRSAEGSPQDVSNQNREEPSAPHVGAHGNPGPSEEAERSHPPDSERSSHGHDGSQGGAGESTQATGSPNSAG